MLTLLSEIHFWSTQDNIVIKKTDYGAFRYSSKKDTSDSVYLSSKKSYCEKRGLAWSPANKRPHKLKDKLKELEEYLANNKVICSAWQGSIVSLLLSKGVVVRITYNKNTNDLISITFDKFLVSKVQNELICDGVLCGEHVIAVCTDGRVFGYGEPWKDCWSIEGGPRRHVCLAGELMVIWGRLGTEHPQPWSPLTKDHQRANLHLYWVGLRGPDLISHKKTFAEPVSVIISKIYGKSLITVEQKVSQRGAVSVEVSVLELINNTLKRASVTAVHLQTQISCSALSQNENFLLLGCIDGSVALLDRNRGSTKIVKASFIPKAVTWHRSNSFAAIANEKGQIQYVDATLNFLKCQIHSDDCTPNTVLDISSYFNAQPTIESINWGPKDLLISLEHGPLILLTHAEESLSFSSLIQRYLIDGKVSAAISLLQTWEFNEQCFVGLQRVVAHLMRLPLTDENAQSLQNALGCYYSPAAPLNPDAVHHFGLQIKGMTRRFFHQLVRASMFETAFLLAVDIGHHDLFMDLHYIAVKIGETEMAAAARAQASTLLSRCSSAASDCSRSSCSQCSETSSCSSGEDSSLPDRHKQRKSCDAQSQAHSENYLTTNFNNTSPKTYSASPSFGNYVPPIPSIDLPKVSFNKSAFTKPQVPVLYRPSVIAPPPLPVAPPLPVMPPLTSHYMQPKNFQVAPLTHTIQNRPFMPSRPVSPKVHAVNFNLVPEISRCYSPGDAKFKPVAAPPLPVPSSSSIPPSNFLNGSIVSSGAPTFESDAASCSTSSSFTTHTAKKAQAKVKFSDTVTAFIVPEIKRPVRPPLPAHVMDPQKELADSLPLCHPNEDYLKDFAPVRRNENSDAPAPKIKVVHFGVV